MNDQTDQQLLRDYAERRSDAAFAELVRRHVDLVFSAALRMVRDSHLAEDITQGAFVALAQNAAQLTDRPVLSGWLHRTAQNIAANAVRSEVRRRAREQESATMNELLIAESDVGWEQIAPHLDAALGELSEPDRDALLLRYFERKSAAEMATLLGVSDEAAQKRVSRAVERLREFFAKRGVTVGASGLVVVISTNAVQAAPVGLAVTISTAAALAGTTIATTATVTAIKTIAMTTLQKTLVAATIAAAVGTGIYETRQASRLRDQVQTLQQQQAPLTAQIQQLTRERNDASAKLTLSATNTAGKSFNWESVESPDYKQYIANLRLAGCPEETIRDIIRADVHKLYEEKKAQVRRSAPPLVYWKEDAQAYIRGPGREMWLRINALNDERNGVLRKLGIEPDYKMQMVKRSDALDLMLDFLPDEDKRAQILRLRKEVDDKLTMRTDNEVSTVVRLRKEMDAAVKQLLTPDEALQYDLRMSATASTMQNQLVAFERTEAEFVALFKLRKAFDDEFPSLNTGRETDAERAKRHEAAEQLKERIKQTLGAERYADYEMALDHNFQQMFSFTKEANLGLAEAKQLYLLRRQAEEQATQIRKDQTLTPESRASASENIRQQTEKAIQTMLGEKGWEQFNRPAHNWWLDTINPRPVQ